MTASRLSQYEACQRLQSTLLGLGIQPGRAIPRPRWDSLVVQSLRIGINQARNITATGEAAGFWHRVDHHGARHGFIVLSEPRAVQAVKDHGSGLEAAQAA